MTAIQKAYEVLFGQSPEMELWKAAEAVIDGFNVPRLGENLAGEVLFEVINHVQYPSYDDTTRIVGRAEDYASELFGIEFLGDEPHMAAVARLEYMRAQRP